MKYKVIKLEDNKSILIDESAEIKEGDYIFSSTEKRVIKTQYKNSDGFYDRNKIIATINHSISLDVPLVIVEDKVKKLAMETITNMGWDWYNTETPGREVARFCATQQKGVYSVEDLKIAFDVGRNYQLTGENNFNEYLQSLKQEYIELEMISDIPSKTVMGEFESRLKTNRVNGQLMAYLKTDSEMIKFQ